MTDEQEPLGESATTASPPKVVAQYKSFPAFDAWPRFVGRAPAWASRHADLDETLKTCDDGTRVRALRTIVRAAAFDTGAIEGLYNTDRGLTMTVARDEIDWERHIPTVGLDVAKMFEAQLAAYEEVASQVADGSALNVTEAWVRDVHARLTSAQSTYSVREPGGEVHEHELVGGAYKTQANHVELPDGTIREYAPVLEVAAEMHRLVREVKEGIFRKSHPAIQASFIHYALSVIHPFPDGNGRVARALASAYLFQAASIPFLVFVDERDAYIDALIAADGGSYEPFVGFVADAGISALALARDGVLAQATPSPKGVAAEYIRLTTAQAGLTHPVLDGIAVQLLSGHFATFLGEAAATVHGVGGITANVMKTGNYIVTPPPGYRSPVDAAGQCVQLNLEAPGPAAAKRQSRYRVFVSVDRDADADLMRLTEEATDDHIGFAANEVHPQLAAAAEHRLRWFIQRVLERETRALVVEAREALEAHGYTPMDIQASGPECDKDAGR